MSILSDSKLSVDSGFRIPRNASPIGLTNSISHFAQTPLLNLESHKIPAKLTRICSLQNSSKLSGSDWDLKRYSNACPPPPPLEQVISPPPKSHKQPKLPKPNWKAEKSERKIKKGKREQCLFYPPCRGDFGGNFPPNSSEAERSPKLVPPNFEQVLFWKINFEGFWSSRLLSE